MLHELLFALLGVPGTMITNDKTGFSVNRSFNILKQQQISLVNEIAQIGYHQSILNQFIANETLLIDYSNMSKRLPSVYRKAFAFGLDNALKQYKDLIISIEDSYLKSKHFTIANIKAQLIKYQLLLPQLVTLVNHINDHGIRGGNIVDLVYEKYQNSNFWFRETLHTILKECYQVLINQINSWILYGQIIDKNGQFFIHRVSYEPTHKFKFSNSNIKHVEITDWEMYTIETNMIPKCFLKETSAGKILFIGKSTKILRNCQKLSNLPSQKFLQQVNQLSASQFSSNALEETIESIRHNVAQKMISLIMDEQQFMNELVKVNDYYLMIKGDFYHLLLEKCKGIEKTPQKQKVQKNINSIYLPNTFQRLNIIQDAEKIRFDLKPLGFTFNGFRSFNHLCPVGNIDLIQGKSIKFNSSDGALWHKTKQIVQHDFQISLIFRFKKYVNFFKNQIKNADRSPSKAIMSIVLQNYQQVSHNSHMNPSNLKLLDEFISIDFGFISNEKQTQFSSFFHIVAVDTKKNSKPVSLGRMQLKNINLNDENAYNLKISYREQSKVKNFRVSIGHLNNPQSQSMNELSLDLSLPYYLNLQMGRAHIGFISNLTKSNFCAELDKWQMVCTALNHYGDHWSDLCLSYKISWPLDLVLTPDVFDNFLRVHKFLFPVRQTQIQLQQMWMKIPRRIKEQYYNDMTEKRQIQTFQRRLSAFRTKLNLIMNQLWKYFQLDVIEMTWAQLKSALSNTDDFQHLIRMVNKYIKSIQTMFFFNLPKIQRIIHQIIDSGKKFIRFFARVDAQKIDQDTFSYLQEIKDDFDDLFKDLVNHLRELSKINSSPHLYHFSQRMQACTYIQKNDFYKPI